MPKRARQTTNHDSFSWSDYDERLNSVSVDRRLHRQPGLPRRLPQFTPSPVPRVRCQNGEEPPGRPMTPSVSRDAQPTSQQAPRTERVVVGPHAEHDRQVAGEYGHAGSIMERGGLADERMAVLRWLAGVESEGREGFLSANPDEEVAPPADVLQQQTSTSGEAMANDMPADKNKADPEADPVAELSTQMRDAVEAGIQRAATEHGVDMKKGNCRRIMTVM
ncbi:hypothetical protein V8E36_005524 [Tilletia maclaganii]